jgi:hypothetical protein
MAAVATTVDDLDIGAHVDSGAGLDLLREVVRHRR